MGLAWTCGLEFLSMSSRRARAHWADSSWHSEVHSAGNGWCSISVQVLMRRKKRLQNETHHFLLGFRLCQSLHNPPRVNKPFWQMEQLETAWSSNQKEGIQQKAWQPVNRIMLWFHLSSDGSCWGGRLATHPWHHV